jgi:hypothetical protein
MFQGSSFRERLEAVIWAGDDEVDGDVQPAANDNNDSDVPLVANDCNDEFDTDGLMNGSCMPEVIEEKAPVEGICLQDLALRAYYEASASVSSLRSLVPARGGAMATSSMLAKNSFGRSSPFPRNANYQPLAVRARTLTPTLSYNSFARACVEFHTDYDTPIYYNQMVLCEDFGQGFAHCDAIIIERCQQCVNSFYIGITGDPEFRWENPEFGHTLKHRFSRMLILLEASVNITRAVETALVKHYHADSRLVQRIMNVKDTPPGAVSANSNGEHFLYVFWC